MWAFRCLLLLVSFLCPFAACAQANILDDLEKKLGGSWQVVVEGESRARLLKVHGVVQTPEGKFLLEADYGWMDSIQGPIIGEVIRAGDELRLDFTTQAVTKVVAVQKSEGAFAGTFTVKSGAAKGVTLTRIAEDKFESVQKAAMNAAPALKEPSADVPPSCAAFAGGWSGTLKSSERVWLWIVAVDSGCVATYSYGASSGVPTEFKTAPIRNGALAIPRAKGTASFEIRDGEIVRRYSGSDGSDSSRLQKVRTTDDSLARLRASQAIDEPSVFRPDPGVPAACARFFGTWAGAWPRTNSGEKWLHVFQVNDKCQASFAYTSSSLRPKVFRTAEIRNGTLSFGCAPGNCTFIRRGDSLSADYYGPDGANGASFRKVD